MKSSFKELTQAQMEREHVSMIRSALTYADKYTIDQILKDLTVDDVLKKTFEKYFKIDEKFLSEVDTKLLDVPLIELTDRITFNGESLSNISQEQKRKLELRENRKRGALKRSQKRKIREEEIKNIISFWVNDKSEYVLYQKPYLILKELISQLAQETSKTNPSQLELLKISSLLNKFIN